jgi:hypothetical protein
VRVAVVIFVVALAVLVGKIDNDRRALQVDNDHLRVAFAAVVERSPWSCDVVEGERVICAVKDGTLSRLALGPNEQVVRAPVPGRPLGKKKRRHHAG